MASPTGALHVLIAGVTTRPFAVSAVRAGYRVTAIDAFGDLDLRAVATVIPALPKSGRRYGPMQAASAASSVLAPLAAYTSNFENYPRAVARLAKGRHLLGNRPEALARARNPLEVMRVLRRHGLASPQSRGHGAESSTLSWLLKPRRSGGGHGVTQWAEGSVPRGMYLQQYIAGIPGSISFAADGSDAVVLGYSRQLVGDRRLGAGRFRYCGSLLGAGGVSLFHRQDGVLRTAGIIAAVLTREFGLIGLNGVDFIARGGVAYPIEVNPRYSASMELIERAHGLSMFAVHAGACAGHLPAPPAAAHTIHGKAIVFARQDTVVGNHDRWIERGWLADVPRPGESIPRGRPICTVFAQGPSPGACRQLLLRRAGSVYRSIHSRKRRAA